MTKKMLIDATHPEETRVAVVEGNKLEDFDFESAARQQLSGNVYLAKVTRIEPSLQAAFVEYGGNRHGFLAFNEIHPDYYQIPVADRQALLEEDAAEEQRAQAADDDVEDNTDERQIVEDDASDEESDTPDDDATLDATLQEADADSDQNESPGDLASDAIREEATPAAMARVEEDPEAVESGEETGKSESSENREETEENANPAPDTSIPLAAAAETIHSEPVPETTPEQAALESTDGSLTGEATGDSAGDHHPHTGEAQGNGEGQSETAQTEQADIAAPTEAEDQSEVSEQATSEETEKTDQPAKPANRRSRGNRRGRRDNGRTRQSRPRPDVESVGGEDAFDEISRPRSSRRRYKIQEVIKKRQILLVQVLKDERGTKGAALTTYLSIAGRYCVLMPNTARGGGISRKITNAADRKRLKAVAAELDVPEGMGLIIRTAGANRTKAEIKRDFEYLLRQWENIRSTTLESTAPALINEEGSLIKRVIRDQYDKDVEIVLVEGEEGYREAKGFMRMLMPSHAKKVQPHRDPIPLFQRYQIERQLDSMFDPTVRLKSGGYIVIDPTEALVSIDVNSGKATREANIEATALRTNLEAAEEVARQLRLRDLAGLVVIDFIDMENNRNNRAVEKRIKDCLKSDRARIQVGRISAFGLLEMSRQRLRQGVVETTTSPCPNCGGTGLIRSVESLALHILRGAEEEALRKRHKAFDVAAPPDVAIYILNQKRDWLEQIETRCGVSIYIVGDAGVQAPNYEIKPAQRSIPTHAQATADAAPFVTEEPSTADQDGGKEKARKPRRRRPKGNGEADAAQSPDTDAVDSNEIPGAEGEEAQPKKRRSRRSRRGGRNRDNGRTDGAVKGENSEAPSPAGDQQAPDAPTDTDNRTEDTENVVVIPITTGAEPAAERADETSLSSEASEVVTAEQQAPAPAGGIPETKEQPAADEPKEPAPDQLAETGAVSDAADTGPEPQAAPEIETAPEPEPASEPKAEEKPAQPKRGGWWQRRFGGA